MHKTKLNKIGNLIDKIKNDINLPIISDFLEWFYEKLNLNFNKKFPKLTINKGDIYFVNLGKNIGSELNKVRPCIIISNINQNNANTVIVLPLKSYKGKVNNAYQIIFKCDLLKSVSIVDFLSIRQIDKRRLNNYVGKVSKQELLKINNKFIKMFEIKNKE